MRRPALEGKAAQAARGRARRDQGGLDREGAGTAQGIDEGRVTLVTGLR
jgi:hypothetical protein